MKNLNVLLVTFLFMVIGITTASTQNVEIISKNYPIKSFSSVKANTVVDIVYTQSNEVKVSVNGVKELVNHLIINVDDGVLTIENDIELNNRNNVPVVVFISSPTLKSIETYGKGNLCLKGRVETDNLIIKSYGIGKVQALNLQSEKVCVSYDGIGNLKLGGATHLVEIHSTGVGNIDCKNLVANTAIVRSEKIGKVKCFASETIGLYNEGIGEITYHGNPTYKDLHNAGMGKINKG